MAFLLATLQKPCLDYVNGENTVKKIALFAGIVGLLILSTPEKTYVFADKGKGADLDTLRRHTDE